MTQYTPSERLRQQIESAFNFRPLRGNQSERFEQIRTRCSALAELLAIYCPEGRELSLALTNLEQAMCWAIAAISRGEN